MSELAPEVLVELGLVRLALLGAQVGELLLHLLARRVVVAHDGCKVGVAAVERAVGRDGGTAGVRGEVCGSWVSKGTAMTAGVSAAVD